jgi:creatinine amidohydrolase/Fe(II)-dependent formamide hydrolase-like protein
VKAIIQEEFGDADGLHGTASELSIVQYLFEGLIGSGPQAPQPTLPFDVLLTRAVMRTRYPDGSINTDQNRANADAGKRLFDASVEVFAEEMRNWPVVL